MKSKHHDFEKICVLCEHARYIPSEDCVLCNINGIVLPAGSCNYFSYDLLKRNPPKEADVKPLEFIDINEAPEE